MDAELGNLIVVTVVNLLAALSALAVDVGASLEYLELLNELIYFYIENLGEALPEAADQYPEAREILNDFQDFVKGKAE